MLYLVSVVWQIPKCNHKCNLCLNLNQARSVNSVTSVTQTKIFSLNSFREIKTLQNFCYAFIELSNIIQLNYNIESPYTSIFLILPIQTKKAEFKQSFRDQRHFMNIWPYLTLDKRSDLKSNTLFTIIYHSLYSYMSSLQTVAARNNILNSGI